MNFFITIDILYDNLNEEYRNAIVKNPELILYYLLGNVEKEKKGKKLSRWLNGFCLNLVYMIFYIKFNNINIWILILKKEKNIICIELR